MCGLYFSTTDADNISLIRPFIEQRGRDEFNIQKKNNFLFLHSRLSINNNGIVSKQPVLSKSHRFVILFNGEIYNYKEVSQQLYGRKDINDTTLLKMLIDDFDIETVISKLNGMFAILVYDLQEGVVHCARDKFGQKPLFFSNKINLRISSSISSLAKITNSSPSEESFKVYSCFGYFPIPRTAYNDIAQLEPGTITTFDTFSHEILKKKKISHIGLNISHKSNYSINEVNQIFDEAMDRHLNLDSKSCLLLSGGVDSSLVSEYLTKKGIKKSFSVGFPDNPEFDESNDAMKVANYLDLDHSILNFTCEDYFKQIKNLNNIYEQPLGDSSSLPTSLLMKVISENGFKIAYGGDGGDELFFGYKRHKKFGDVFYLKSLINYLTLPLKKTNIIKINSKIKRLHELCSKKNLSDFILFTRNLSKNIFDYSSLHEKPFTESDYALSIKSFDILSIFSNDLMVKTDRPSMYYGTEVRNPIIDLNIDALSNFMILNDKFIYRQNKKILKELLKFRNPNIFIKNKKKGFSIPVDEWITLQWKEWAMDLMSDFLSQKKFDYDYTKVEKILDNHMKKIDNSRDYLWSILMYQNWLNQL